MTGCVFVFRNRKGAAVNILLYDGQRHEEQVKAAPARWLPWNDQEQLAESFLQRGSALA